MLYLCKHNPSLCTTKTQIRLDSPFLISIFRITGLVGWILTINAQFTLMILTYLHIQHWTFTAKSKVHLALNKTVCHFALNTNKAEINIALCSWFFIRLWTLKWSKAKWKGMRNDYLSLGSRRRLPLTKSSVPSVPSIFHFEAARVVSPEIL